MEAEKPGLVMGKVYLIPTTLGDNAPLEVLPISVKGTIERIDHYIVENEKTARRFIKRVSPSKSQPDLQLYSLNKYTNPEEIPSFLDPCIHGFDVGIISEAGCPGIADPGADVIRIAHERRIKVVPLVGPSSILMAMMSSGMNGQNFAFNGYLPIDNAERKKMVKNLERVSRDLGQSQIFMETPYRNNKLLKELLRTLQKSTRLCIAADITLPTEFIATKSVHEWSEIELDLDKRPTIYIIQA
ncbi:SAM-dependent methyltransferase [Allomuricauda sp. ARW1Y1]|jgi:16S rRNA (cytidine1402-2'-O)-methyltransferase|uniref:SAM-dependent methyltransferase n=1 Tax=Allomuricauda sp. ARW1Y1 TaxID=2663843 RepID=UPI0015CA6106|nr:SAM-dependent methyltransferase [Muricauda sp. ARW1Y1]NYJ27116.1 16S rRNA (cytidine1402-2'-O)-methyltransferase [Muricauda sp. ARW1Y1]